MYRVNVKSFMELRAGDELAKRRRAVDIQARNLFAFYHALLPFTFLLLP